MTYDVLRKKKFHRHSPRTPGMYASNNSGITLKESLELAVIVMSDSHERKPSAGRLLSILPVFREFIISKSCSGQTEIS